MQSIYNPKMALYNQVAAYALKRSFSYICRGFTEARVMCQPVDTGVIWP